MPAMRTIRIHAIPLSDDEGYRACTVTPEAFATAVEMMNGIYEPAALRFAFDPARDWHPRKSTALNRMTNGAADFWEAPNEVAAEHRGEYTVFLRWGSNPRKPANNWFAYPPDTGQTVPPSAELPCPNVDFIAVTNQASKFSANAGIVLAHETGHFLGLFHTHPGWGITPTDTVLALVKEGGLEALDGDLLADTPPDPSKGYYAEKVDADICAGPDTFEIEGHTLTIDRSNVMSYFRGCVLPVTLSPQQIAVIHKTLEHASRSHLVAASGGVRYAGVFRASGQRQALWVHDTWDGFKQKWQELSDDGLRLVDFDATRVDGKRRFTGVFHEGGGAHALWVDDDWAGFEAKWRELSGQGLRLIDLESWADGGARRYAGVFRAGTDAHALWVTSDWANFKAKWQELSGRGLRLVDLSTWADGSRRRYAGVYRAGTDGHALWVEDDWAGFEAKWRELSGAGLRLIDFARWTEGGKPRYAGVFRAGTDGHALWVNDDWYGFERQWQALAKRGLRLVDVEVYGSLVGE